MVQAIKSSHFGNKGKDVFFFLLSFFPLPSFILCFIFCLPFSSPFSSSLISLIPLLTRACLSYLKGNKSVAWISWRKCGHSTSRIISWDWLGSPQTRGYVFNYFFFPIHISYFNFFLIKTISIIIWFLCLFFNKESWTKNEVGRNFFENYAKANGFDPLKSEDWYSQSKAKIKSQKVFLFFHFSCTSFYFE